MPVKVATQSTAKIRKSKISASDKYNLRGVDLSIERTGIVVDGSGNNSEERVWIRFSNTSGTAIYFEASGEDKRLGDARLFYDIFREPHHIADSVTCHVCSLTKLDNGNSILFSVPVEKIRNQFGLRIEYNFEWDDIDKIDAGTIPTRYAFLTLPDSLRMSIKDSAAQTGRESGRSQAKSLKPKSGPPENVPTNIYRYALPAYPPGAIHLGLQDTVNAQIVVDKNGSVKSVTSRCRFKIFTNAVEKEITSWRFERSSFDSRTYEFTFVFRLLDSHSDGSGSRFSSSNTVEIVANRADIADTSDTR